MNAQLLIDTAKALVADDKGVLAIDESHPTCNKRFAKLGIPQRTSSIAGSKWPSPRFAVLTTDWSRVAIATPTGTSCRDHPSCNLSPRLKFYDECWPLKKQ